MKQFLITVGGVLVGLVLFLVIGPIILFSMIASSVSAGPAQPSQMVLSIDLRQPLTDQRSNNPFASLNHGPSLMDLLERIDAARTDNSVKGIYIRANTDGMPAAQAEELRTALAAFRHAGKFVVAHMQNDGARTSMAGYLTVADSDEVWLQDSGDLMPMGLAAEVTFFGNTLTRYHVQAQFEAREEYKTYANTYTQSHFTPAHREELTGMMTSIYDVMLGEIAADRGITPDQARTAIESTPMTAQRAVELHLVDKLGRPEDAEESATKRANNAEVVEIADYRPPARHGGDVIAVVQGEGAIVSGPENRDLFSDDAQMNSDQISQALLDASEADDVKAIVFRVSSPGGSVVASDQILHALDVARQRGKKVIISMGEVAASGGYYISAHADEIIASPTTITGSIGVVGGKMVIGDAMEHYLSANTDSIIVGSQRQSMFSSNTPFNQADRATYADMVDRMYATFINLVAEGRHMTQDQAHAVAHGRVWTGQQALERHLVDRLGGFSVAVDRAKALAGLQADAKVQLRFYPTQENPFAALSHMFGVSAESAQALARLNAALSDPRLARAMAAMREEDANVRAETDHVQVR